MYCERLRRDYHGEKFEDINCKVVALLCSLTNAISTVEVEIDSPPTPCVSKRQRTIASPDGSLMSVRE